MVCARGTGWVLGQAGFWGPMYVLGHRLGWGPARSILGTQAGLNELHPVLVSFSERKEKNRPLKAVRSQTTSSLL